MKPYSTLPVIAVFRRARTIGYFSSAFDGSQIPGHCHITASPGLFIYPIEACCSSSSMRITLGLMRRTLPAAIAGGRVAVNPPSYPVPTWAYFCVDWIFPRLPLRRPRAWFNIE